MEETGPLSVTAWSSQGIGLEGPEDGSFDKWVKQSLREDRSRQKEQYVGRPGGKAELSAVF